MQVTYIPVAAIRPRSLCGGPGGGIKPHIPPEHKPSCVGLFCVTLLELP